MADAKPAFIFYHYYPSLAAAVVFVVLFVITTAAHAYQLAKNRTWYFIPFVIGGFFEWIGYIGRVVSSQESPDWTKGPYICQSLLLLLAPALFAASIYMVLSRIILLTDGESHSVIKAKWLTKTFVFGDVLSFLAQSAGGGMLAKSKDADGTKTGEHIIIGGLFIQVVFFGFFILTASIFHYRIRAHPTTRSTSTQLPWQRCLMVLYVASAFITVRSIFRIAEYIQGSDGFLLENEIYLYVFDGTLMLVVMVSFNIWHPNKIISKHFLANASSDPELLCGDYPLSNRKKGGF